MNKNEQIKSMQIKMRLGQAFCLGVFALGISMLGGDIAPANISSLSITTTCFGLIGSFICELMVRQADRW
jgi:hypothetical protein